MSGATEEPSATPRKRHRDGIGKGENSYKKHDLMQHAAGAYIGKNNYHGGNGIIIDMHAGDGVGVLLPQPDFFRPAISDASPKIAARMAADCIPPADIVLCEKKVARRAELKAQLGAMPFLTILGNNAEVLRLSLEEYEWAVVLNDPCGHGGHSIEVMQEIARRIPRSDFIVAVNEGSLRRHLGLTASTNGSALARVRASYATKEQYRWMLSHDEWRNRLGKRKVFIARNLIANRAFQGRVLVLSNARANLSTRLFSDG